MMSKTEDFKQLFNRLYLPLSMYALRITGDPDAAHDVVQESMMALWQKMKQDTEIDNPIAYLYTVCRNRAIACSGDNSTLPLSELENLDEILEEEIDTSFRDARLWRAIEALPEKTRKVFLMSKRDGLKYREIAEQLGISQKTVENQISNALSKLRSTLSPSSKVFFLPFL